MYESCHLNTDCPITSRQVSVMVVLGHIENRSFDSGFHSRCFINGSLALISTYIYLMLLLASFPQPLNTTLLPQQHRGVVWRLRLYGASGGPTSILKTVRDVYYLPYITSWHTNISGNPLQKVRFFLLVKKGNSGFQVVWNRSPERFSNLLGSRKT